LTCVPVVRVFKKMQSFVALQPAEVSEVAGNPLARVNPLLTLNRSALKHLPPRVSKPGFALDRVRSGIVHLGVGGFHRSHMARYLNNLMNMSPDALRWGILGAGLTPEDDLIEKALVSQDFLYTLIERNGASENISVIGSLTGFISAHKNTAALIRAMCDPAVKIVSLTITPNGYCLNPSTRRLDLANPMIARDFATPSNPGSAIGVLAEAYRRRRTAGLEPFTAVSCDNIPHNGRVLRNALLDYSGAFDPGLAEWIGSPAACFPNTMVDRITPATRAEDITGLASNYGIVDNWPVISEAFSQWVVEDRFGGERPELEKVGVQFVENVFPYELMKLRLLNGSHLAIAVLGRLMGFEYVDEAMRNGKIRGFMKALMDRETGPTLLAVPGVDLDKYKATLVERFANPAIKDQLERINTDAPLNVLVDPATDRLERGASVDLLALAIAAWIRRIRGRDETGARIEIRHPLAKHLLSRAAEAGSDPRPILQIKQLFGELGSNEHFVSTTARWLRSLDAVGTEKTLTLASSELSF
jgi:mannitol 2-dehydrogenase